MMSFYQKLARKETHGKSCCGKQMIHKSGYDTDAYEYWTCTDCGKHKWIAKNETKRTTE